MAIIALILALLSAGIALLRFRESRRTGELLTSWSVAALVCLLAATVFGVRATLLRPPYHIAKKTQCFSHAKQRALALLMYAEKFDDRLPIRLPLSTANRAYERPLSPDKFVCPSDPEIRAGVNRALLGPPLSKVHAPAEILLQAETRRRDELVERDRDMEYPHTGTTIVGFVDGHVKSPGSAGQIFWADSRPARIKPRPEAKPSPLPRLRDILEPLVVAAWVGGAPILMVMFLAWRGNHERRRFWGWAAVAWLVIFGLNFMQVL